MKVFHQQYHISPIYVKPVNESYIKFKWFFFFKYLFQMKIFDQQYHISSIDVKPINES